MSNLIAFTGSSGELQSQLASMKVEKSVVDWIFGEAPSNALDILRAELALDPTGAVLKVTVTWTTMTLLENSAPHALGGWDLTPGCSTDRVNTSSKPSIDLRSYEALLGDLEERYQVILQQSGQRGAAFWYWRQVIISLPPIIWAWAKRMVFKPVRGMPTWAMSKGLVGDHSWLTLVLEIWKRIRS